MITKISAFVITKNEEQKIVSCLTHLSFADEIVVLDSGSTDATVSLTKKFTKKIFTQKFEGYGPQKQAAIDKCSNDWILEVDADEIVTPELALEIKQLLSSPQKLEQHAAYTLVRQEFFLGKPLMRSSILRLYRKDSVHYTELLHEKLIVQGSIGKLRHMILHESDKYETIANRITKINLYTKKEAEIICGQNPSLLLTLFNMFTLPFIYFSWQYFFQWLIFKGYRGLIWSLLTAYYHFLIHAKVYEYIYKQK
ncbi:glycosyltransferase family 2 protein, partial [Candidatus Woesearchaeota archaeon]|nr:glycosyltransferase family 2 protein [Candidatus Woesearchaeota archaeon]